MTTPRSVTLRSSRQRPTQITLLFALILTATTATAEDNHPAPNPLIEERCADQTADMKVPLFRNTRKGRCIEQHTQLLSEQKPSYATHSPAEFVQYQQQRALSGDERRDFTNTYRQIGQRCMAVVAKATNAQIKVNQGDESLSLEGGELAAVILEQPPATTDPHSLLNHTLSKQFPNATTLKRAASVRMVDLYDHCTDTLLQAELRDRYRHKDLHLDEVITEANLNRIAVLEIHQAMMALSDKL